MGHLIRLSDALAAIPGGDHCDPQAVADALRALPAAKQFATLYQHSETGRTRVVMFGDVADCDARWQVVGPLVIAQASAPAVALNGLTEAETSATASVAGLTPAAAPKEESPAAQQLVKVLTVVRDTLPHIGGNAMSVHSLLKDIDAALSSAPRVPQQEQTEGTAAGLFDRDDMIAYGRLCWRQSRETWPSDVEPMPAIEARFDPVATPQPSQPADSGQADAREALANLVHVVKSAGLDNLVRGVQLGPTVWHVKASDAMSYAERAIASTPQPSQPADSSWTVNKTADQLADAALGFVNATATAWDRENLRDCIEALRTLASHATASRAGGAGDH